MESNVAKALRIDEWTAEALTTSCVDDTFFILHKCGSRCRPAARPSIALSLFLSLSHTVDGSGAGHQVHGYHQFQTAQNP